MIDSKWPPETVCGRSSARGPLLRVPIGQCRGKGKGPKEKAQRVCAKDCSPLVCSQRAKQSNTMHNLPCTLYSSLLLLLPLEQPTLCSLPSASLSGSFRKDKRQKNTYSLPPLSILASILLGPLGLTSGRKTISRLARKPGPKLDAKSEPSKVFQRRWQKSGLPVAQNTDSLRPLFSSMFRAPTYGPKIASFAPRGHSATDKTPLGRPSSLLACQPFILLACQLSSLPVFQFASFSVSQLASLERETMAARIVRLLSLAGN